MPSISQKESRSSTTSRTESDDIRIAAIDIGSNSIRQIIADVSPTGTIRVVDEMKAAPRLGAGIHETGELSREAGDAAIEALGRMEALARQLGARRTRAVATSAVRDAGNSEDWLARVKLETGLDVEVLDGDDEARLSFRSAQAHFDLGIGRAAVIDVGGGSLELVLSADGRTTARSIRPRGRCCSGSSICHIWKIGASRKRSASPSRC